jgi:hypothetical protein
LSVKESELSAEQDLSRAKVRADRKRCAEETNPGMSRPYLGKDKFNPHDMLVKSILDANQKKEEKEQWRRKTKEREFGRGKLEFRVRVLRDLINDAHGRQEHAKASEFETALQAFLQKYDDLNGLESD